MHELVVMRMHTIQFSKFEVALVESKKYILKKKTN